MSQEYLSTQSIHYLVEIEDEVKLTDIVEELIQHLYKVVNGLKVSQVVVAHINTDTEIEPCIASVHDLEVPELKQNEHKWILLHKFTHIIMIKCTTVSMLKTMAGYLKKLFDLL